MRSISRTPVLSSTGMDSPGAPASRASSRCTARRPRSSSSPSQPPDTRTTASSAPRPARRLVSAARAPAWVRVMVQAARSASGGARGQAVTISASRLPRTTSVWSCWVRAAISDIRRISGCSAAGMSRLTPLPS
ncbi:MAG: hypothetical protein PGN26_12970 [Xylophilus ampelinus]